MENNGMKMAKVTFALLVVLMGMLFASLSVESYQVVPSSLKPGQSGVVQITLKNVQPSGSTSVVSVEDVAVYFTSVPGLKFTSEEPVRVGTIEGGASAIAT